jgi:hypothetical protein
MPKTFEAGNRAPSSGVYKVVHGRQHVEPHHVTVLYGDTFPACLECLHRVRFELAIPAAHINAHPLFMRAQTR